MAKTKFEAETKIEFKITLEMSFNEAQALATITKYSSKAFLEHFYKGLGSAYLKTHEEGVVSLFDSIRKQLPPKLAKAAAAIDAFNNVKTAF